MPDNEEVINITFATLYELLRLEKNRPELQKFPEDIYKRIIDYLKERHEELEELNRESELFVSNEKQKLEKEYQNIRKIIESLYEIREKKILHIALNKSRRPETIVDTTKLTKLEKQMLSELVELLNKYREGILYNLLALRNPKIRSSNQNKSLIESNNNKNEISMKVRFKKAIPKFVWEDLKEYGPFEKGEIAILPAKLAKAFLEKEVCEEF